MSWLVGAYAVCVFAQILSVTIQRFKVAYWPLKAVLGLLYLGMVQREALDWKVAIIFLFYYLGDLVLGIPTMETRTKIQWGIGLFGAGHVILGIHLAQQIDAVMIGLLVGILFFSFLGIVRYWIRTFNLEGLMWPVNAYVLILMSVGVMGWMAASTTGYLSIGITLFIISDGWLAAWHLMRKPKVFTKVLNILFYYPALVLMIISL